MSGETEMSVYTPKDFEETARGNSMNNEVERVQDEQIGSKGNKTVDEMSNPKHSSGERVESPLNAPERLWLRNVERDGHSTWTQSAGHDYSDVEYVRADLLERAMETHCDHGTPNDEPCDECDAEVEAALNVTADKGDNNDG